MHNRQRDDDSVFIAKSQKGYLARNALFQAAIDLIADAGIDGFSIHELCTRAGLKRTSFYTYFQTLDELIDELSQREEADFESRLESEHGELSPGARRLSLSILQFLKISQEDDSWNLCMLQMLAHHEPTAAAITEGVKMDIEKGIELGEFDLELNDADAFSQLVFATLQSIVTNNDCSQNSRDHGGRIVKMLMRAGGADENLMKDMLN